MIRSSLVLVVAAFALLGSASAAPPPPGDPTPDDLVRVDVRGTAASIASIAHDIDSLPIERRTRASESLDILVESCPYTHAALQIPYALQQVVLGIDAERLDPLVQRDWEYLQAGLTTHIAVLDALDVDRDARLSREDPIGATTGLIDGIPARAERIDGPTLERIELHSALVEAATGVGRPCPRGPWALLPGQPWTLGMQLGGWHDALRRIQPFARDAEVRADIAAMIGLLDAWSEASLAGPGARIR